MYSIRLTIKTLTIATLLLWLNLFHHAAYGLTLIQTHPVNKNIVFCEVGKNFPVKKTAAKFGASLIATRTCGYRHPLSDDWIMGISLGFKSLRHRSSTRKLDILALSHEAHRVFRVQHPLYLTIAFKTQYLAPTVNQRIPTERDPNFETEVGAAIGATFWYFINKDWNLHYRWERWRGTKTTQLQGYETAIGLSYQLH